MKEKEPNPIWAVAIKRAKARATRRAKIKLLPCPFCGAKAAWGGLTRAYDFGETIECTKCGINTGPLEVSDKKAAQIWNRRSNDSRNKLADEFGPLPTFSNRKELISLLREGMNSPTVPLTKALMAKIRGKK